MTFGNHVEYRLEEVVERAYSAYVSAQSGVDRNGQRHHPWQELPANEKSGWMAAINTAIAIAEGRKVTDPHALREAELRGQVPDNQRPGAQAANAQQSGDTEDEPTINKGARDPDDVKQTTSKKAHASGR